MRRFIVLVLVLVACGPQSGSQTPTTLADTTTTSRASVVEWDLSKPFVGFSLSPNTYDEAGFNEFFETASNSGDLVAWVGAWEEITRGGTLVYDLATTHGYVPIVVTGFPTDNGRRVLPNDSDELIQTISTWVAHHPVPFLGFGVEINSFLWEEAPEDFEWFVGVFGDLADEIHAVSPETVVFPGFQLERLRGLKGGLFGGEDTDAEWALLEPFSDADAIGFTTYPGLIYTDPAEIPVDYYQEILQHVDVPIVFTEVGWQAGGELGDWTGSPEKQARFVSDWVGLLADSADMLIWSFLWDQEAGGAAFGSMGLIDGSDGKRSAFGVWQDLFG